LKNDREAKPVPEEWYDGAYFNRKFCFRFGDCDSRKRASLYALMKLLSELSGEDYERRGLGYDYLAQSGRAMLLSRMRLKFSRLPYHTEKVIATTWERGVKGPYFYRDYEVKTEKGELLVSGSSHWFLIDITTREVLRPSALIEGKRQIEERKSDCSECEKLRKIEALPVLGKRPVFYTDLDGNAHVNNAVYARIAVDFLPDEIRQKEIKEFSINYFIETKLNESLELAGGETANGFVIQGSAEGKLRFGCVFGF
jgi:medium-chain acyl-[acyl-carrier-protein] hydrolase